MKNKFFLNEPPSLPEKDDKLVKVDKNLQNNAWLPDKNIQWRVYSRAYKRAADILIEHIIGIDKLEQNLLVYPILFLYRHCIELEMKIMIEEGKTFLSKANESKLNHDIIKLWEQCREILESEALRGSIDDLDVIDAVEELIKEFSRIDPSSQESRYPKTIKGEISLSNLEEINLSNLKEKMAKIEYFFLGYVDFIIELKDSQPYI